jgi:uncharacterized membrane protein YedE/YeeE
MFLNTFVLYDDFDPIATQSLAFTSAWADMLFYTVASSAVPAGFSVGLVSGVLLGAFVSALASGRFQWQSFTSPQETGRYLAGAALMGVGGVLAGGCAIGAGLSGIPTLSITAILTFTAITAGAMVTNALLASKFPRARLQPAQ